MRDDKDDIDAGQPVLTDAAFDAWPAAIPPAGFADRVLAARAPAAPARPRRWPWLAAGAAAAVAVGALLVLVVLRRPVERGSLAAGARTEARLAGRAVAVAEAGAALSWTVEGGGAARVEQARGDVFYRVERGGPFIVATPAGTVEVEGTSFRVEVMEMKIGRQALAGAAVGAAVTAVALVTVYEGRVLLANEKGRTELRAGERASAATGGAPGPAVDSRAGAAARPPEPAPPAGATREELVAREGVQRREIARLQARVAELEASTAATAPPAEERPGYHIDMTHDELVRAAKECRVTFDSPSLSSEPARVSDARAAAAGLGPDESAEVARAIDAVKARTLAQLRALYVEVTGNAQAAEDLSAEAIMREIEEKSGRAEVGAAQRQLSAERAGLAQPPASLAGRPPVERMLRILMAVGDDTENEIAKVIGPDRAHAFHAVNNGWDSKSSISGCPSEN